jgi:hypothetical protein
MNLEKERQKKTDSDYHVDVDFKRIKIVGNEGFNTFMSSIDAKVKEAFRQVCM